MYKYIISILSSLIKFKPYNIISVCCTLKHTEYRIYKSPICKKGKHSIMCSIFIM